MITLIDISLIGTASWLKIAFNCGFSLTILVAMGMTVDFNIHIVHRTMQAVPDLSILNEWERQKRLTTGVMMSIGSSVFHGAFSTLICVIPPALVIPSRIGSELFTMMAITIVLGIYYSLIALPVFLTLFPIQQHDSVLKHAENSQAIPNEGTLDGERFTELLVNITELVE